MGIDSIASLDADLWFERLRVIMRGELRSLENSLRHAFHLAQLTPVQFRNSIRLTVDDDSFEALLEAGNLEGAAACLLAALVLVTRIRTRNAVQFETSVYGRDRSARFVGHGTCAGSAALACWLSYLSSLAAATPNAAIIYRCRLEGLDVQRQPLSVH